jgi:hypothetical protein
MFRPVLTPFLFPEIGDTLGKDILGEDMCDMAQCGPKYFLVLSSGLQTTSHSLFLDFPWGGP